MASSYPGGLDSFATNRTDSTTMATTHATDHNNENDAINKIEAELGINPSAAYATVLARLDAMQAQINAGGGGGGLVHPAIKYVSTTGSDANDGSSWGAAKATIQSAYDALPAPGAGANWGGGFVFLAPGRFDVGSGVTLAWDKPARFASFTGGRHYRYWDGGTSYNSVVFSSAGTRPVGLFHLSGNSSQAHGFEWDGLVFDQATGGAVDAGIYAEGCQMASVNNCGAFGVAPNSTPRYMVRAKMGSAGDNSWWRINNCNTSSLGICYMGAATDGNCNQHVISHNVGLIGQGIGIKIEGTACHRNVSLGNNLEGTGGIGIWLEGVVGSAFIGDGGEGASPFIHCHGSEGNLFAPNGIASDGTKVLVEDHGFNLILGSALAPGTGYGGTTADVDRAVTFTGTVGSNIITPFEDAIRPKPAHPSTLQNVIDVLQQLGLTA